MESTDGEYTRMHTEPKRAPLDYEGRPESEQGSVQRVVDRESQKSEISCIEIFSSV